MCFEPPATGTTDESKLAFQLTGIEPVLHTSTKPINQAKLKTNEPSHCKRQANRFKRKPVFHAWLCYDQNKNNRLCCDVNSVARLRKKGVCITRSNRSARCYHADQRRGGRARNKHKHARTDEQTADVHHRRQAHESPPQCDPAGTVSTTCGNAKPST